VFKGIGDGSYELGPDLHVSQFATVDVAGFCDVRIGTKTLLGTCKVGGNGILTIDLRTASNTDNIARLEIQGNGQAYIYGLWDGASTTDGTIVETVVIGGTLFILGGVRFAKGSSGTTMVVRPGATVDLRQCIDTVTFEDMIELHLPCNWMDSNQRGDYSAAQFKVYAPADDDKRPYTLDFGKRWDFTITALSIGP
jgi:hypothetical protein